MKHKKQNQKYSLTRRIVGLTVFLDALFLIVVVVIGMFLFLVSSNQLKERYVLTESKSIVDSTEHLLYDVSYYTKNLAVSSDVILYLEYINQANNPIIDELDPNYVLYQRAMFVMNNDSNIHGDVSYNYVFISTELACDDGVEGCIILNDGRVLSSIDGWNIEERDCIEEFKTKILSSQGHIKLLRQKKFY